MAASWPAVVDRLKADAEFRARFESAYPEGITPASIRNAIATYERALVTSDAPFDRYLRGDAKAIGEKPRKGYERFKTPDGRDCLHRESGGGVLVLLWKRLALPARKSARSAIGAAR